MPADKDENRSTPFGLYDRGRGTRVTGIEYAAVALTVLWLGISGYSRSGGRGIEPIHPLKVFDEAVFGR